MGDEPALDELQVGNLRISHLHGALHERLRRGRHRRLPVRIGESSTIYY